MPSEKPVAFPATILVDTREQRPYAFAGLRADRKKGGGPLVVTLRAAGLPTGDYSIEGFESRIAIERKSKSDLYHTLSQGRVRFERELARLQAMEVANVVVEAELSEVLDSPPPFSRLTPKSVFRSVIAWKQRFRNVHWDFVCGREMAEVATFRTLERFFNVQQAATRQKRVRR